MKRREFIRLLGGATIVWPLTVRAQPAHYIGMLMNGAANDATPQSYVKTFSERLRQLGWIEEHNVHIDNPAEAELYCLAEEVRAGQSKAADAPSFPWS